MPLFTITIDTARDNWVHQVLSNTAEEALSIAIGMLPHEDSSDLTEEDENFLVAVATGKECVKIEPVSNKIHVWNWPQGDKLCSPMYCHIIQTVEPSQT